MRFAPSPTLVVSLALFSGACGGGNVVGNTDPCQSAGCDANAHCDVIAGAAACICDNGYTGDGHTCTAVVTGPCAVSGVCDAHATCTVVGTAASCACDTGYSGDGHTCTCDPDTAQTLCQAHSKNCGSYTATNHCGTAQTVDCGASCATGTCGGGGITNVCGVPPPAKESWVWVYFSFKDLVGTGAAALITNNKTSFTHLSPTFYTVNYDYQSGVPYYTTCPNNGSNFNCTANGSSDFGGITTKQFTDKATALGLLTVPAIYGGAGNSGTDQGIINILNNTSGARDSFVASLATEADANGYAGYNLDWEVGASTGSAYADKLVALVNALKTALGPGRSVSVDAIVSNINGTWCSGNSGIYDFAKLAASSADRIVIEAYMNGLGTPAATCPNTPLNSSNPIACDFTLAGSLNLMCSSLPLDKAVIGVEADPSGTNPIAGSGFTAMKSYGFTRVAVWPQYPFMSTSGIAPSNATWYALLADFLQ